MKKSLFFLFLFCLSFFVLSPPSFASDYTSDLMLDSLASVAFASDVAPYPSGEYNPLSFSSSVSNSIYFSQEYTATVSTPNTIPVSYNAWVGSGASGVINSSSNSILFTGSVTSSDWLSNSGYTRYTPKNYGIFRTVPTVQDSSGSPDYGFVGLTVDLPSGVYSYQFVGSVTAVSTIGSNRRTYVTTFDNTSLTSSVVPLSTASVGFNFYPVVLSSDSWVSFSGSVSFDLSNLKLVINRSDTSVLLNLPAGQYLNQSGGLTSGTNVPAYTYLTQGFMGISSILRGTPGNSPTFYVLSSSNGSSFTYFKASDLLDAFALMFNYIQPDIAKLRFVLASDSDIQMRSDMSDQYDQFTGDFTKSDGKGTASSSQIGDMAGVSDSIKSNFSSDASTADIFNQLSSSDNWSFFSSQTQKELNPFQSFRSLYRSSDDDFIDYIPDWFNSFFDGVGSSW